MKDEKKAKRWWRSLDWFYKLDFIFRPIPLEWEDHYELYWYNYWHNKKKGEPNDNQ